MKFLRYAVAALLAAAGAAYAADVTRWSETAATNATADPDINFAEGQLPGSLNNSARAMMQALKKRDLDLSGSVASTGSANVYAMATRTDLASLSDGLTLTFRSHQTNTSSATFNPDGLGANSIVRGDGSALVAGDILTGNIYTVTYVTGSTHWRLRGVPSVPGIFANTALQIYDTNASHVLSIVPGSNITANRALTITTGDADRTVTLSGDLTVSGTATIPAGTAAMLATSNTFTHADGITHSNNAGGILTLVDANATSGRRTLRLTTVSGLSYLQTLADDLLSGSTIFAVNHATNGLYFGASETPIANEVFGLAINSNGVLNSVADGAAALNVARLSSDGQVATFYRQASPVGSISVTGSATAYNTSSDGRLKTFLEAIPNVGATIDALQPKQFEFINEPGVKHSGFVAQELMQVVPRAVTLGDDGYYGVDQSKLMALAIAEIKALRARVATLENR